MADVASAVVGIAQAVKELVWPALATFVFVRVYPSLKDLLQQRGMSIEVGGLKVSVTQATEANGKALADLQSKIASLEARWASQSGDSGAPPTLQRDQTETVTPKHALDREDREEAPSPGRILWVDDHPPNNAFLIDNFRTSGLQIDLALSTSEAMSLVSSVQYNAIITDLGRSVNGKNVRMAGLELINILRQKGILLPVLVFAGDSAMRHRRTLVAAGAEEVTTSGVAVNEFVMRHVPGRQ